MAQLAEWELAMARRRKGEYATFEVYTEGLSKAAQELRAATTFSDDFTGEVHSMKPEVVKANQRKAESYEALAKARSEIKRKFMEETARLHQQRLDLVKKALRPEPRKPEPAHNQVHYENGLVATVTVRKPNAIKRRF